MALRPPSTPRASSSNIPAPGSTPSSLPTPRRKSGISLTQRPPAYQNLGSNELDSLRQAVRRNDPHRYDSPVADGQATEDGHSPSPAELLGVSTPSGARRPVRRPSSVAVRPSGLGASSSRPTTPSQSSFTASRTPSHPPRSRTPTAFGSSVSGRPSSRLSMSRGPSARGLEVGDAVSFEVGGAAMEGTIRFLGEVDGKDGEWGGVELDPEWEGKGKNDGSVKGVQYFACAPLCGLFLPLGKITAKPKPAAPSPATPIASKITAGSRASKYLGVTASQLATNRRVSLGPPASPSKLTATPRRAASPEKPSSAASSQTTPRPRARPSIGGAGFGVPTPRKSLGTPRQSLGASVKRPPSSLRQNTLPDVPRIPDTYSLGRSVTPASSNGRATPSTPSGAGRRLSLATEASLGHSQSRPTTPSVRSYSRQSFASSVSRQSQRSLLDDDGAEDLHRTLRETKEREEEVRQLLDGSERLGREMEDKLAEKDRQLQETAARVEALEQERSREKERELARMAGIGEEDKEQDARRILELEARVDDLLKADATLKTTTDRLAREWETKFAAKEGENESLRERLAAAAAIAEEERNSLNHQIDQLRGAGQALCETYEERIAEIEHHRLEAVDLAEFLQDQLSKIEGSHATEVSPGSPTSPSSRLSSSHNSRTSAADVINAESAQAELEHLQAKMESMEEQLEEARMQLEAEMEDSKKRRAKHTEMEQSLKNEIKTLRESIDRSAQGGARSTARIQELEAALLESQRTLEEERSELEGLRVDASGGASAGLAEEIKRATKQIATLTTERQAALQEAEEARLDAQTTSALVQELEAELDRLRLAQRGLQSRSGSLGSPQQRPTQDSSPNSLQPSPNRNRDSIASNGSRKSFGAKDEATATKEQILGLKVIIKGFEEENAEMLERNKSLVAETKQLKKAQQSLEARVDGLSAHTSSTGPTTSSVADATLRREVDELKTQLKEAEKRSEREIKALNEEIQEMESLVENKIYREDELETELEKYKKLVAKQETGPDKPRSNGAVASPDDEARCEMCDEVGHGIEDCALFAGSAGSPIKSSTRRNDSPTPSSRRGPASAAMTAAASAPWCENCEEYGHDLSDCRLQDEVF